MNANYKKCGLRKREKEGEWEGWRERKGNRADRRDRKEERRVEEEKERRGDGGRIKGELFIVIMIKAISARSVSLSYRRRNGMLRLLGEYKQQEEFP